MKNLEDEMTRLYSLRSFGIKPGLSRIMGLLEEMGNPHLEYNVVHVGGTNGKGSVCRILGSILEEAGYVTGVYTSPHLSHLRERIVVNDVEINDDELHRLIEEVLSLVEKSRDKPTFFEVTTAIAFEYFRRKKVDVAVVEVGLGGRLDATNVVQPQLTVLTSISIDHGNILGGTIEEIAEEKAGILKEGVPLITSAREKALGIIRGVAKEKNVDVTVVDKNSWRRLEKNENGQRFVVHGLIKDYDVETSLLGLYQGENVAVAVISAEKLQMNGFFLPEGSIEKGVMLAENPGRMEVVSNNPTIVLDGAHNPAAMDALVETLLNDFEYNRLIVVLGILGDKDVESMVKTIAKHSSHIIATQPKNERACNANLIAEYIREDKAGCKVEVIPNVEDAVKRVKRVAQGDDLVCITGSLYTVGEARDVLF
ncbi:MAG TPA: bifunctional folylpolyglutamate synthase/dihydrofolate synthase [Thermoplasmatales archaeon]|nr:bifunctional folylpolyglutamate synthase/dihydrofolate synthase [Thermoplasmatales archaeon]